MPRTIVCQNCGIALNLPTTIAPGKRLKCPKCAHRFVISEVDARSASTAPGLADAAQTSLYEVPTNLPPLPDSFPEPRAEGNLRDTFDLPSLGDQDDPGLVPEFPAETPKTVGDVSALFDPSAAPRRRKTAAESRSQARRCTSCQGFVPAGMSICQVCGLDQETGIRIDLDEDTGPKGPPPKPAPPLHVSIVGGICGISGIILALIALIVSVRQDSSVLKYGWLCLALVSGFAAFASYEFVRGKSVKLLLLALTLGVFVNFAGMIVLPVFKAQFGIDSKPANQGPQSKVENTSAANDTDEEGEIPSLIDRLEGDLDKIYLGLVFIGVYVGLAVYLMSPTVKRYINRRQLDLSPIALG